MTHTHTHDGHTHTHDHTDLHDGAHTLAPSGEGTVMLDIGASIGAVVIHTAPRWHGLEIEVSPVGPHAPRKHAAVRARHLSHGTFYSAVIDGLPEGRYVVWRDATTPADRITVTGGAVTEYDWPD